MAPLPAIPRRVGFMPASSEQIQPAPYWYVSSPDLLWSFFGGPFGGFLLEERCYKGRNEYNIGEGWFDY